MEKEGFLDESPKKKHRENFFGGIFRATLDEISEATREIIG